MGVEISGLDEFEKMLADAEKRQRGAVNTFLKVEAEELLGAARDKTPTRTHQLKNSWERGAPENGMISVYNNTEYAAHVEYGHRIAVGKDEKGKTVYAKDSNCDTRIVKGAKMLRKSVLQQKAMFRENAKAILEAMFQ